MPDPGLRGFVLRGYEPVRDTFASLFERGWDIGSAFTAYVAGTRVVHLQGGVCEPAATDPSASLGASSHSARPYDETTLQLVASASKFVESLGIALLVDRGLLRYDDRIADHWPELVAGGAGKGAITVRQLMMHRAGLPVFERKLGDAELFDVEQRARFLERQTQVPSLFAVEPRGGDWRRQRPAPPQAYHAVSRGLYASELTRRVDPARRTLGQLVRDELAAPLGLPFWIGLPEAEATRLSPMHPDGSAFARVMQPSTSSAADADPRYTLEDYEREFLRLLLFDPASIPHRALQCLAPDGVPPLELARHPKFRACELPSSNGFGTAWALAALASLAVEGGVFEGHRIFTQSTVLRDLLSVAESYDTDGMMLTQVEFTQGGLARFRTRDAKRTVSFGWGGAGGQMTRIVPDLRIGCAYLTNTAGVRMAMNDPRPNMLLEATIVCARQVGAGEKGARRDEAGDRAGS